MIKGETIENVVTTIISNAQNKRDFILDPTQVSMDFEDRMVWTGASGPVVTTPTPHASNQIADFLGIPRKFYERLRTDAPDLIRINVNRLLEAHKGERRMVRTLDGNLRAWMSDRYRTLDHEDVAEAILPVIKSNPDFIIESAMVTDSRLYFQVVSPKLEGEIRVGDVVQGGFQVSNSEIGLGCFQIVPFLKRLRCVNGMTGLDYGTRKAHMGGRVFGDEGFAVIQDDTRKAMDAAFWLEMRDNLSTIVSPDGFQKILASMRESANDKVEGDPGLVVEELTSRFSLRETESKSVLYSFLAERDHTRWGLANAVTEVANAHPSYDRAVELQAMGGTIMGLQGKEWASLTSRGK